MQDMIPQTLKSFYNLPFSRKDLGNRSLRGDSFTYPKGKRAPVVELENIQIVNGGQTSNALFEAYHQDPEKIPQPAAPGLGCRAE